MDPLSALPILCVALGGAVGATARLVATELLARGGGVASSHAVLAVNVAGCFAIGVLLALLERHPELSPLWRQSLAVGLLGSFTTYSTFGHDTFVLLERGLHWRGLLHVAAQVVLGLVAVALGRALLLRLHG